MVAQFPALTVKQPWAHMIAYGGKTIENRGWETRYRGMFAIHAGKGWDRDAEDDPVAVEAWSVWIRNADPEFRALPFDRKNPGITFAAVIAVADLTGCHEAAQPTCACSPWAEANQWHWELSNIRPLANPIPCLGKLGLWRLPEDTGRAVRDQLA